MIDPSFVNTGLLDNARPGARITRFQVLGERSSGTNLAKRLLGRNSDLNPCEVLGWKHGFPHADAIPRDLAVIGIVRRADDWALSMHARPWHCTPEMQGLAFSDFIRAEWDTVADRPRYFEGLEDAAIGQPLQHDRHPLTGRRFANIFALRQAKLDGLLSYLERDCNFILLRIEDVAADPEAMLDRVLASVSQHRRQQRFKPVHKRLGSKFRASVENRPAPPESLSSEDVAFLRENVNLSQEGTLGYRYD